MNEFLFWVSLFGVLIFAGCHDQSNTSALPDLDSIHTLPELNAAEEKIELALLDDPSIDGGHVFGQLAAKAVSLSRLIDAERLFQKAILSNPESPDRGINLHGLSSLYRVHWKFVTLADMICCLGKTSDNVDCCPSDFPDPDSTHQLLRDRIVVDSLGEFSKQAGREYIAFCQSYALLYPDRLQSAAYLNEGAKLAASLRMPVIAVRLYQWVYTRFKTSEIAPKARFLEAFTLENDLKDLEAARTAYEGYLKDYPEDIFAKDARILLENLGKDPEEMIREFQKQE